MRLVSAARRRLRRSCDPLLDLLFPPTCWVSGVPITREDQGLAPAARLALAQTMGQPYCRKCGATLGPHVPVLGGCPACSQRDIGVQHIVRAGRYEAPLKDLVGLLKFHNHWEISGILAGYLVQALTMDAQQCPSASDPVLMPVPLHWRRHWQRGFNQAQELALPVAQALHWPLAKGLKRVRPTAAQSHVHSATARRENLLQAFSTHAGLNLAGKTVWLLDDVCTTGATLHAAATALRRLPAGARPKRIHAVVLALAEYSSPEQTIRDAGFPD